MGRVLIGLVLVLFSILPVQAQLADDGSELENIGAAVEPTHWVLYDLFGTVQIVKYAKLADDAMLEGDLSLGLHDVIQRESVERLFELVEKIDTGALSTDTATRDLVVQMQALLAGRERGAVGQHVQAWPGTAIAYVVQADITDTALRGRIDNAIAYWNSVAPVKLVKRTNQNDFLRIRDAEGSGWNCSAQVGYRFGYGGHLNLNPACPEGTIVHEMLHVAGIMHEHQRANRDTFITMAPWASTGSNLGKRTVDWATNYDICSISQYSPNIVIPGHEGEAAYSLTPEGAQNLAACKATLKPQCKNAAPGQRCQLSPVDIAALEHLY